MNNYPLTYLIFQSKKRKIKPYWQKIFSVFNRRSTYGTLSHNWNAGEINHDLNHRRQKKNIKSFFILILGFSFSFQASATNVRIKDIATIGNQREVELIGYGLVSGLDGTGDKAGTNPTTQSMVTMLKRMGVTVNPSELNMSNVAAVVVTARVPIYIKPGSKCDAIVSSLGNASSLQDGNLLLTSLQGIDGKVYATAQGKIHTDPTPEGKNALHLKFNNTVGSVLGGVMLEKELPSISPQETNLVTIELHQPDFVTAERISEQIRQSFETNSIAVDPVKIQVTIPSDFKENPVGFLARLESLNVDVDDAAKVVINEKTGTVIAGKNVKISAVAISHGHLKVEVSNGSNVVLPDSSTVTTMVSMLNNVGATPNDIAVIFKTLKKLGALKAELVII